MSYSHSTDKLRLLTDLADKFIKSDAAKNVKTLEIDLTWEERGADPAIVPVVKLKIEYKE